jgi:hypothetical protein
MKKILQLAALALVLAAGLSLARSLTFTPTYCGDPCSPNGDERGCIDNSGPVIKRVICTCVNGRWAC